MKDLTHGSPLKLIAGFAVSLLAANLMSQVYSLVDSMMVGRLVSTDAIGAISASSQIIGLVNSLTGGLISGCGIVLGRCFGGGDHSRLRHCMANILYLVGILSVIAVAVLLPAMRPMLIGTHTPEILLPMATDYSYIIVLSLPLALFGSAFGSAFRSLGDSRTPLLTSLIGGAANVGFNAFFIMVLRVGTAGAALGTACSYATSLLLNLLFFFKRLPLLRVRRADAGWDFRELGRLFLTGLPVGMQNSITSVSGLILQSAVNRQGVEAVTAFATSGKITGVIWTLIATFETTLIFYAAQNRGAGDLTRIRQGVRQTSYLTFGMMAVITLVVFLSGDRLFIPFVGEEPTLLAIAETYCQRQLMFFPFMVMLSMLRGAVQGMGYTFPAVACGVVELASRFVVTRLATNLDALMFAGPAAWVFTTLFLSILYPVLLRHLRRHLAMEAMAKRNMTGSGVPCAAEK